MVTPILLKRSTTSGNVPSSLAAGELAQNIPDEMAFFRNPSGVVTPLKLPDCERFIARGSVSNAASVIIPIDPAVIGIMRMFVLHLTDWRGTSSGNSATLRFGDSGGIDSGSSDYEWGHFYCSEGNGSFFSTTNDRTSSSVILQNSSDITTNLDVCGTIWFGSNDAAAVGKNWAIWNISSTMLATSYWNFHGIGYGARTTHIDLTQISLQQEGGNISVGKYELIGIL